MGTDTVGACFDATIVGQYSDYYVLLENLLERPLLWFVCRHHIFEILVSDVFAACMGPSSGPDVQFYKHFQSTWLKLNHQPQDIIFSRRWSNRCFAVSSDHLDLINLAANIVGLPVVSSLRRPGQHRKLSMWQLMVEVYEISGRSKLVQKNIRSLQLNQLQLHIRGGIAMGKVKGSTDDLELLRTRTHISEAQRKFIPQG